MSKAALACLALLFGLSQSGCDRPSLVTSDKQPTHDAAGYLIQPKQNFLVGGESRGWNHLFIQFEVNGQEANPFILTIGNEILPNDDWPLAPENKPDKQTGSGFMFSKIEEPPRPLGWFSLNTEEVTKLAEGVRKYFQWSDTAVKENLNVTEKGLVGLTHQDVEILITNVQGEVLMGLTNQQVLNIAFSRPKDSSHCFINVFIMPTEPGSSSGALPSFCSITLDKMGVDRLLSVITNLPSRRQKFITFRDEQDKIARQRQEAAQNEKTRADALLH